MRKSLTYLLFSLLLLNCVRAQNMNFNFEESRLDSLWTNWLDESNPDSVRMTSLRYYLAYKFGQQNADSMIHYARVLLDMAEQKKDSSFISVAYNSLGLAYSFKADYANSLKYFHKSLAIKEDLGNSFEIAITLGNISMEYAKNKVNDIAIRYAERELNIYKNLESKEGLANTYNKIGVNYFLMGDYNSSKLYFDTAYQIAVAHEIDYVKHYVIGNLGEVYMAVGQYEEAYNQIKEALRYFRDKGWRKDEINGFTPLGRLFNKTGAYDSAVYYCSLARSRSKQYGFGIDELLNCKCLVDGFEGIGNSDSAHYYSKLYIALDDSLKLEETFNKMQQDEFRRIFIMDSLRRVEEKQRIQTWHREEIDKKNNARNIAIAGGFLALLLAGAYYSRWLYVKRSKAVIESEKDRSDNLLLNILPSEIAEELKEHGKVHARDFDQVTILFTDFKEFTAASEKLSARDLVDEINICFEAFDRICEQYGIEKIKTIGDSYMAAGGLPVPSDDSVRNTVLAGLEMARFIVKRRETREAQGKQAFEMRVGINTGPVVAGIVGVKKFQYDLWGDTVNTASRMESSGEAGRVNVSEWTYNYLKDDRQFSFEPRGKVEAKGKGEVEMYFVEKV